MSGAPGRVSAVVAAALVVSLTDRPPSCGTIRGRALCAVEHGRPRMRRYGARPHGHLRATRPARGRAPALAHRRADAPRRPRGELLVPPPPGGLRVDRRAHARAADRRPRLRGGVWIGGAGTD